MFNSYHTLTALALSATLMLGCQPSSGTTGLNTETTKSLASSAGPASKHVIRPQKMKTIHFDIQTDNKFSLKQQANPAYIQARVHKGSEEFFPENSSDRGLISIGQQTSVNIAINVPEGDYWIIDVAFLYTPSSEPVQSLKSQFNVPVTGSVPVNIDTYLTAAVVEELYKINPSKLSQISFSQLKAYIDALTGFTRNSESGAVSYTRLTDNLIGSPLNLSPQQLALEISTGAITPSSQTGELTDPISYLRTPSLRGSTKLSSGLSPILPPAATQNKLLFFKADPGKNSEIYLVGMNPQSTSIESFFQHNLGSPGVLSEQQGLPSTGKLENLPYISTMVANPSGESLVEAGVVLELRAQDYPALKVFSPDDGRTLWSYDFNTGTGAPQAHNTVQYMSPAIKRLKGDDLNCECDDDSLVILPLASLDSSKQGIYAIQQKRPGGLGTTGEATGESIWFYPQPDSPTRYGGSLSEDQSLYFFIETKAEGGIISYSLSGLDTSTGLRVFSTPLDGSPLANLPSIGRNGTAYQITTNGNNSKIYAINNEGTILWDKEIRDKSLSSPLVDHKNGEDILYLFSHSTGKAYAYYGSTGIPKWQTPANVVVPKLGEYFSPSAQPVLGELPGGERILYASLNKTLNDEVLVSSKVYSVKDKGDHGELNWSFSPGGTIVSSNGSSNALSLYDNMLYVGTRDGGDGQFVNLRAIKVETPNMPPSAPWPSTSGNKRNQRNTAQH